MPTAVLPDAFDSIAAMVKFLGVPKLAPEFYSRHWRAVEFANAFTRVVLLRHESIRNIIRKTLPLPVAEIASELRAAAPEWNLVESDVAYLDQQMTEALRVLVPVVRDKELPIWLLECRGPIEDAFEYLQ